MCIGGRACFIAVSDSGCVALSVANARTFWSWSWIDSVTSELGQSPGHRTGHGRSAVPWTWTNMNMLHAISMLGRNYVSSCLSRLCSFHVRRLRKIVTCVSTRTMQTEPILSTSRFLLMSQAQTCCATEITARAYPIQNVRLFLALYAFVEPLLVLVEPGDGGNIAFSFSSSGT